MHNVWYDYVVYLINMVVVDGYAMSWRQAINSMMMHASHRMSGVAQCSDRNLWNTTGFHQWLKALQLTILTKVNNTVPELKSTTPALMLGALKPVLQNLS